MEFSKRSGLSGIGLIGIGFIAVLFGVYSVYAGYSANGGDTGDGAVDESTGTYTGSYTGTDNSITYTTIALTTTVACQTTNYPSNLEVITITHSTFVCSYPSASTSGSRSWTTSSTTATYIGADNSISTTVLRTTSTVLCQTTNYPSNLQVVTITSSTFVCRYTSTSPSTTTITRTSTILCQTSNYPRLEVITITRSALACTYTTTSDRTITLTLTKTVACQTTNYPSNLQVITVTRTVFACTYATASLNYVPSLSEIVFLGFTTQPVYVEAFGGMLIVFGILFMTLGIVLRTKQVFHPAG